MRTAYSKGKSDAVAKEDGTFIPKNKRKTGEGNSLTQKHPKKSAHAAPAASGGPSGAGQAAAAAPPPAPAAVAAPVSYSSSNTQGFSSANISKS